MKKAFRRGLFIILLLLPVIALAHFIVFPQETRCILVRFSNFEHKGNLYFRMTTNSGTIDSLTTIKTTAEKKAVTLWGEGTSLNYTMIFCSNEKDYNNYGHQGTPACTQLKLGAYVVLNQAGLDTSILAHEIMHTIIYNKLGWYITVYKLPAWFSEGLAMQADDRPVYSTDSLQVKLDAGLALPDMSTLAGAAQFFSGDIETVMLHYSISKYVVRQWLKTHSLQQFVADMENGTGFDAAYNKKN